MTYKYFHTKLILRVILMLVNVVLAGTALMMMDERDLFFLPLILLLVLVFQITDFIIYTNRTNNIIARFVNNLVHKDLNDTFTEKSASGSFQKLFMTLNDVVHRMSENRLELEAQYNYLREIIDHINTGIISIKGTDEIHLINNVAKKLLVLGTVASWNDVRSGNPDLTNKIDRLKEGRNQLLELTLDNEPKLLSVNVSSLKISGTRYRIITLQDIRTEIEQKEIEAWYKLIQVLRHEIRNSVTPISSMTETISMLVRNRNGQPKKPGELSEQDLADLIISIHTVQERSEHLYNFVEKYRQLTGIPLPVKEEILLFHLLNGMAGLFREELLKNGICLVITPPDNTLRIEGDPSLIEQVLINLIKNSMKALQTTRDPEIRLSAKETQNHATISVADNGEGIEPGMIRDIFLPFFTTHKEGTGIGLALSRQIMNLHGGFLSVESDPGIRTIFTMAFPK